jgi:hypothetical protein
MTRDANVAPTTNRIVRGHLLYARAVTHSALPHP